MCKRPKLIVNPQAKYLLHRGAIPFVCGVEYTPFEVLADLSVTGLLSRHYVDTTKVEDILYIKDSCYLCVAGNRFPLFVALPCFRCSECSHEYRKEIENRALIEAAHSGTVIFYTLSYDNEHLPKDGLCKSHVVRAFKRLRTHISRYLDFECNFINLYVGEYGTDASRTMRPHYHGLLFVEQRLTSSQLWQLRRMFPFRNRALFYQEHKRLKDFWPYGIIGDFQVARNPAALTRYVTKYITKQHYFIDDPHNSFAVQKEKFNGHYNPCFVQMPRRFGLGSRHLSHYKDTILNSSDLSIRININGSILRIGIPKIFIQKLFPSLGRICPSARYHVAVASHCLHRLRLLGYDKDELRHLTERLSPYLYLLEFDCKRRERRKIELTQSLYLQVNSIDFFLEVFETLMRDELSNCLTDSEFRENIQLKSDFYKCKELPEISYQVRCLESSLKAEHDVNYCKKILVDSYFDRII